MRTSPRCPNDFTMNNGLCLKHQNYDNIW
jgi:hypothetical protein